MYQKLCALAERKLSYESHETDLDACSLVHETYLVLAEGREQQWDNRGHFYVAAAETMRRILIRLTRRRNAQCRGGGVTPEQLVEDATAAPMAPDRTAELIALDEVLTKLAEKDERKARLVSLRYFVGLTIDETAAVLNISKATAKRDWVSPAWLQRELERDFGVIREGEGPGFAGKLFPF